VRQHRREATNLVKELSLYVFLLCVVKWYRILGEVEALTIMSAKGNTSGCDATLMKVCGTYRWGYYFDSISVAKRKAGKLKKILYYFIMIWRERNGRNEIARLVCFLWLYRTVASFMNSCVLCRGRSWGEAEWCLPWGLSVRTDKLNIIQEK
jgi:hypothetical protein